jgi:acyl phosphate:glycerol-3-phosphate acyltransferase
MWLILTALVVGYAIGNFSPSYILVRLVKGEDIRNIGSGNAGTANAKRALGFKWALVVFFLDILKGALAVWVGRWIGGEWAGLAAGLGAVLGHNFPALLGFRGGKGVATTGGMALAFSPPVFRILLAIFIVVLVVWRYMSLASMTASVVLPVLLVIFNRPMTEVWLTTGLALLILYQHRGNIQRLLTGVESKFRTEKKTESVTEA